MQANTRNGFGAVEAVAIVLVVAVLGLCGWFFWHARHPAKVANYTAPSSTRTNEAKQSNQPVPATQTYQPTSDKIVAEGEAAGGYLPVKEWGVRFKLGSDNSDAYYVALDRYKPGIYLSLDAFKGTDCAADKTSEGAITRFTAQDTDPDRDNMLLTDEYKGYAVQLGDYYYVFTPPQAACSEDQAVQTKADNARKAFVVSAKQVEVIPAE